MTLVENCMVLFCRKDFDRASRWYLEKPGMQVIQSTSLKVLDLPCPNCLGTVFLYIFSHMLLTLLINVFLSYVEAPS